MIVKNQKLRYWKKSKTCFLGIIIISLIVSIISIKNYVYEETKAAKKVVQINKSNLILQRKEIFSLKIKNIKKKVSWKSSNRKVVTVNKKGQVTAKGTGAATVTATVNKKKYRCKVEVIALNTSKKTLEKGEKLKLQVKGTKKKVFWKASNTKVAVVNRAGTVTAKGQGKAQITATVQKKVLKASITVKQKNNSSTSTSSTIKGDFKIHFIDVGQADCILIQDNGKNILIDAGNIGDEETIVNYIKKLNIIRLDKVFLTHGHEDHIGSFQFLPEYFTVQEVYINEKTNNSSTKVYKNTMAAIKKHNIKVIHPKLGSNITFGKATAKVVGPVQYSKEDENANSISFVLTYGETKFFFGGDMTQEGETEIREKDYELGNIDVYKVSHHGSCYSSSYAFVRAITERTNTTLAKKPFYAVISTGKGNSYGHPHDQTVSRLNQAGATIYRTDLLGSIICKSDGAKITWDKTGIQSNTNTDTSKNDGGLTGEVKYIGNANSKIVHSSSCSGLPIEKNRVYFSSVDAAVKQGYRKCQNCLK